MIYDFSRTDFFKKDSILSNLWQNVNEAYLGHIYLKNLKGEYLGINSECLNYLGLPINDVLGKTDFDLLPYNHAIEVKEFDTEVIKSVKKKTDYEIDKNGRYFLSRKIPIKDSNGSVIALLGVSMDVTHQKELEYILKVQTQELGRALALRERFIRNINHEINTPMQGVLVGADCLGDPSFDEISKKKALDLTQSSALRLNELLSNILVSSDFESGKFDLNISEVNLKDLLANVLIHFSEENIDIYVEKNLPLVKADQIRVKQVIKEILNNCIKHGGQTKPINISITTHEKHEQNFVKFSVKDEGVGVPNSEKKALFDMFIESSRTAHNGGGKGLGLYVCKQIIMYHHGSIWFEDLNAGEVGTRISFELPIKD